MSKPDIAHHKPNKPDFKLPEEGDNRPPSRVIRLGMFTWKLQPLIKGQLRLIEVRCTKCPRVYLETWPIRSTNLNKHWEVNHKRDLRAKEEEERALNLSLFGNSIGSSPNVQNTDTAIKIESTDDEKPHYESQLEAMRNEFDPEMYTIMLTNYFSANNLPFAHIESPTLTKLLEYVRRCDGDLPSVSRRSLESTLDSLYERSRVSLKEMFAKHEGRFAITLEKWESGKDHVFLGITVHLHDTEFVLRKYAIGFEVIEKARSNSGDLVDHLDRVLQQYGIRDRIISITRDDTPFFNDMMMYFKINSHDGNSDGSDRLSYKDLSSGFTGDVYCVGNVFNLAIDEFLACTFFRSSEAGKSPESSSATPEKDPDHKENFSDIKDLPILIDDIVKATHKDDFFGRKFRDLVKRRKEIEGNKPGPKTLLPCKDSSWISIYNMLDRFLYFRPEITKLLVMLGSPMEPIDLGLKTFIIEDSTWEYLSFLHKILEAFLEATIELQDDNKQTIHLTIPFVSRNLIVLNDWKHEEIAETNPSITLGISKACATLLEYYPVNDPDLDTIKNLFLASMLDPHLKMNAFQMLELPAAVIKEADKLFRDTFHRYEEKHEKEGGPKKRKIQKKLSKLERLKFSSFYDKEQFKSLEKEQDEESEVNKYFAEDPIMLSRSITDYYEKNKTRFPTIYRMAKDYLSMRAMATPTESLFSCVSSLVTDKQGRIQPETISKLAILKARDIIPDEFNMLVDNSQDGSSDEDY